MQEWKDVGAACRRSCCAPRVARDMSGAAALPVLMRTRMALQLVVSCFAWLRIDLHGHAVQGCTEAWLLILTNDEGLAGVLVAVWTIQRYTKVSRDVVVIVGPRVTRRSRAKIENLCVIVKQAPVAFTVPCTPVTATSQAKVRCTGCRPTQRRERGKRHPP